MRNFLDIENEDCKQEGMNFKINYKLDQVTVCLDEFAVDEELNDRASKNSGNSNGSSKKRKIKKRQKMGKYGQEIDSLTIDESNELLSSYSKSNGSSGKHGESQLSKSTRLKK